MRTHKLAALLMLVLVSCAPMVTAIPTVTSTSASAPTKTIKPTPTSVSTSTSTATKTTEPTPIIYPTQVYGLLLSPDGTKKVQSLDWNNYEILTPDGRVLWSLSYENKFGVLEPAWRPFYWSLDGKYIYFTCYHGPDDGSTKFFGNAFLDGDCIYRFDVDTGKLVELIPEIHPGYYAFAVSPDGSQLVYANQTEIPIKIKFLDLNTNKEKVLLIADEKVVEIGSFGWSPKKDELIFTTLEMLDEEKRIYSIFLLDLKKLKTQILIENMNEWLEFKSWNEQGQILYRDTYYTAWQLNLESQELVPLATATPLPSRTPMP